MSDYGFKTIDKTNSTVINAKNPIFGFDMGHIPRAFKTFHFDFTSENPIVDGAENTPSYYQQDGWHSAETSDYGTEKRLLLKVKHGYKFRPVGYVVFTGKVRIAKKYAIKQTELDTENEFGGDYEISSEKTDGEYFLLPTTGNTVVSTSSIYPPELATIKLEKEDFTQSIWPFTYEPQQLLTITPYGQIVWSYDDDWPKIIWAEIDDEYIYFYSAYQWTDTMRRVFLYISSTRVYDLLERVKVATQYTGSSVDATVYLCPYPIEELLNKTTA